MTLRWTSAALGDRGRLHDFLHKASPVAVARVVHRITEGPDVFLVQPRVGTRLTECEPREVRDWLIGDCELRYEIDRLDDIWILRIWHTKEWR